MINFIFTYSLCFWAKKNWIAKLNLEQNHRHLCCDLVCFCEATQVAIFWVTVNDVVLMVIEGNKTKGRCRVPHCFLKQVIKPSLFRLGGDISPCASHQILSKSNYYILLLIFFSWYEVILNGICAPYKKKRIWTIVKLV